MTRQCSTEPADPEVFTRRFDRLYSLFAPAYDAFVKLGPVWKSWLARALPHIRGPRVLRPGSRLVLIDVGYPDDQNKEARTTPSRLRLYYSETGSMSAAALTGNAHA